MVTFEQPDKKPVSPRNIRSNECISRRLSCQWESGPRETGAEAGFLRRRLFYLFIIEELASSLYLPYPSVSIKMNLSPMSGSRLRSLSMIGSPPPAYVQSS